MAKSEITFTKMVWYVVIGFFMLIIVISFGMPDFLSHLGSEQNTVAEVNGERIQSLEYVRFRDNMPENEETKKMSSGEAHDHILRALIFDRLQLQQARELGIQVSSSRVKRVIGSIPFFRNELGDFDARKYARYLDHYRFSKSEYFYWIRDHLTGKELVNLLADGAAVPPDDISVENAIMNSSVQIRYCFASNWELRQRFKRDLEVSDSEVEAALGKVKADAGADPASERARIRSEIESKKFEDVRRKVVLQVAQMARLGNAFEESARYLGGRISTSAVFKIGEHVKSGEGKTASLASLTESSIFSEDCLAVEMGKTSRAVPTLEGVYVFTPVKREIAAVDAAGDAAKEIQKRLAKERFDSLYNGLMSSFSAKSKISRNPKFMESNS